MQEPRGSLWGSQQPAMASVAQANTHRKRDFSAHFSMIAAEGVRRSGGVGEIPTTRTGAVWMISIWHSSTFSHSWFRFELLVHLDLCCWFNKQAQYTVHHANCIIKLLTYFQTSSFFSSVPLSFPSFPLFFPCYRTQEQHLLSFQNQTLSKIR